MKKTLLKSMALFMMSCVSLAVSAAPAEEDAVNLALNKPVVAGASAMPANEVNDGNMGSRWASGAAAHHVGAAKLSDQTVTEEQSQDWYYVDLGEELPIDSVRFLFEGAYPIEFKIFTSSNATDWTLQVHNMQEPKAGQTAADYNVYPFTSTVTARYVKFLGLTAKNFDWGIKIWEMEVFSNATNVALNKTAKAGNNEEAVAGAIDGNLGSMWVSLPSALHYGKPVPAGTYTEEEAEDWIYVDLGGIYYVHTVRFLFEGACPADFDILTSKDAITWTKQLNITETPKIGNNAEAYNTYSLGKEVEARYVKIFARKAVQANFAYGISIWEFEVFGSAVADTEKPVLTSATLDNASFDVVTIKLVASDNLAVTQCQVIDTENNINGAYPVSGDILTIDGLKPSTTYNFTIQALDGAGNASEATATIKATTIAHDYEPQTAAPAPEVAANLVLPIYSDTYEAASGYGFADWGGGYVETKKTIDGNNYNLYTANSAAGYFGMVLNGTANAAAMLYWHFDIWAEEDMTVDIYPIDGKAEHFKTATLKGQQWNSIDLTLADYTEERDWANVFQIKLAGMGGKTIAVDNIYFYRDPIKDDEVPTDVTVSVATTSFFSVTLACSAKDNSGAVNFDVFNGEQKVATGGAASEAEAKVVVANLQAGTSYNLSVVAYDANGNKADAVPIEAATVALPQAAATPTQKAEDAFAIYSDAYTPAVARAKGYWGDPTQEQEIALGADDRVLLYTTATYLGWELNGNQPIGDLTDYPYLHMDIYLLEAGSVRYTPIWGGEALKEYALTKGWNVLDIDLKKDFPTCDRKAIYQMKWDQMPATMFIDNVYFYKGDGTTTLVDAAENQPVITKTIENGQVVIIRDGVRYNVVGNVIR